MYLVFTYVGICNCFDHRKDSRQNQTFWKYVVMRLTSSKIFFVIELKNNKLHGLSPPGGSVSPPGRFTSFLFDQGVF